MQDGAIGPSGEQLQQDRAGLSDICASITASRLGLDPGALSNEWRIEWEPHEIEEAKALGWL